ncbi:hypothetical protein IHQ71_31670 (plasmid) [Rhizobium sp. TH2]|uniref:hypothetical protein n=1 Tax=Rhizobium sp. TH2 TaxID=2775403 RepID=UPI0021580DE8|nr:hypothetical protein [Rhizobium sp. TH2]UVC12628.1 hypothetical protein IHQ71_31670 [Rhizobium sp. TH2]
MSGRLSGRAFFKAKAESAVETKRLTYLGSVGWPPNLREHRRRFDRKLYHAAAIADSIASRAARRIMEKTTLRIYAAYFEHDLIGRDKHTTAIEHGRDIGLNDSDIKVSRTARLMPVFAEQ